MKDFYGKKKSEKSKKIFEIFPRFFFSSPKAEPDGDQTIEGS